MVAVDGVTVTAVGAGFKETATVAEEEHPLK